MRFYTYQYYDANVSSVVLTHSFWYRRVNAKEMELNEKQIVIDMILSIQPEMCNETLHISDTTPTWYVMVQNSCSLGYEVTSILQQFFDWFENLMDIHVLTPV